MIARYFAALAAAAYFVLCIPEAHAESNKICAIILCFPIGFAHPDCKDPLKEYLKLKAKGRSPIPALAKCVVQPGADVRATLDASKRSEEACSGKDRDAFACAVALQSATELANAQSRGVPVGPALQPVDPSVVTSALLDELEEKERKASKPAAAGTASPR